MAQGMQPFLPAGEFEPKAGSTQMIAVLVMSVVTPTSLEANIFISAV